MENNVTKITSIEAICLIITIAINRIILNLPQNILDLCGSSAILNVIYISIIATVFVIIIVKLYKHFTESDIIDISEFVGGKVLRSIIGMLIIIYFLLITGILLRNFSEILYIAYYKRVNILFIMIFFVGVCIVANLLGERAIIKSNMIFTIIMFVSLILTFIFVIPNIVMTRIFPILGNGAYATFFSGLSNIFSFNGLICIYFIMPLLNKKNDYKKVAITAVVLIGLLLFFSTACLLLSITFSKHIQSISPLYVLIKNNEFGKFLQHPESLFVFAWILSIMTYLNVLIMFALRITKKISCTKSIKLYVVPICLILLVVALVPQNISEAAKIADLLYKYYSFPLTFIILPAILIIANIKFKKKNPHSEMPSAKNN